MKKNRSKTKIDAKRWAAYATAGAAVALTGTQAANADVTVIDVFQVLEDQVPDDGSSSIAYTYVFEGGATMNFSFQSSFGTYGIAALYGSAPGGNAMSVAGGQSSFGYPSNLAYGDFVSSAPEFFGKRIQGVLAWGGGRPVENFVDTGGYLGFRFNVGNGTQYGWASMSLVAGAPLNKFQLDQIAFASPGETLYAGQQAIPEPGSLACLALGAIGLVAFRRKRAISA